MPNEISNSSYYTIVKRDTESKPIKKSQTKAKNPVKVEVYVKISKNLGMWKPNSTKSDNVKKVKEELKKVNTSEKLKKRLRNMNVDLTVLKLDEMIKCNPGSVARKLVCGELKGIRKIFLILKIFPPSVQCNKGAFQDQLNTCSLCPFGSYNNLLAQASCIQCPEFHSTRKVGSRLESDCRQLCSPGTFARVKAPKKLNSTVLLKTLMPFCRSCGFGEYQAKYDQTTCDKCPEHMTSDRGSKSVESCYEKYEKSCNDSTCGEHGKCITNGAFYTCECLDGYFGQKCELKQDQCSVSPCFNGGLCTHLNDTDVACECPPGFNGAFCEFANDPCNQKNCQHGAHCNEFDGDATCDCLPGFEGESCERMIPMDFCESSPCANGATCINQVDDYECVCDAGMIGKRCHLTACDYKPCHENAICVNLNLEKTTKESF